MKTDKWYENVPGPVGGKPQLAEMTSNERVAHELKRWRGTWGMSQRWLAQEAGTTQRVISLLEAGKYNPTLTLLERLAEAMNMRVQITFGPRPKP